MNYGSPLTKDKKKQKAPKPEEPKEETFAKKAPCKIKNTGGRTLVESSSKLTPTQCEWIERWLDQFIRERCLPPQILGTDPLGMLTMYLTNKDALEAIERIRRDFVQSFPQGAKEPDDFQFLLGVVENPESIIG